MRILKENALSLGLFLLSFIIFLTAIPAYRRPFAHIEISEAAYYEYTTILRYNFIPDETAQIENLLRQYESNRRWNTAEEMMVGEHTYLRIVDSRGKERFINIRWDYVAIDGIGYYSKEEPTALYELFERIRTEKLMPAAPVSDQ